MKVYRAMLIVVMVMFVTTSVLAAQGRSIRNRKQVRENLQELLAIRQAVREFFAAKDAGKRESAMTAAENAAKLWRTLPEKWQNTIEQKHPGTKERILGLKQEFDLPDDFAVSSSGVMTGSGGKTIQTQDTWTKEGSDVAREGTTVAGDKSITSTDTWTKDGKTIEHQGTSTTSGGKTSKRDETWTKDGTTVTHEGTRTGFKGGTAEQHEIWTKSGNTVTYQGTVFGTRNTAAKSWQPNYKDDLDIFGGRPQPRASQPQIKVKGTRTGGRK
jgi:type II secretory pathway pseudopilin PulG